MAIFCKSGSDRLIIDKFCQIANGVEFHEWSKSSNEYCFNISIL